MPFDITPSRSPDVLILRAHGPGTSEDVHRAFQQLQHHPDYCQGIAILVDAAGSDYVPSASDARTLAGLFATAFPCSRVALVCADGAPHAAAREVTRLAVCRGATVATFTDAGEGLAWLLEYPAALPPRAGAAAAAPRAALRRVPDGVVIPYTLREKIESALVEVDGHDCPLRLDSTSGRPLEEPDVAEVTVSTEYAGTPRLAVVDLPVIRMDDEDYVVATLVGAMRAVLAADGPGAATASAARR